jgi:O-antigen/teichoic acid export membrane protein/glycosyltransferase involved in cell wall biosynthesis
MSVGARAMRGAAWIAGGGLVQALLGGAALIILARTLSAADFGAAAAALASIALIDALCGLVLPDVLRAHDVIEDAHIDATFWLGLIIAFGSAAAMTAFAPEIASFFGAGQAAPVFAVAAWLLPLGAAGAIPAALLSRDLKFRHGASISAASSLAGFVTAIAAALAGLGLWSLVAMEFARRIAALVFGFAYVAWRPGFRGGVRALRPLARFNAHSTLFYTLGFLDDVIARLLLSRLLGLEALGIYAMARRLLEATQGALVGPFAAVALSASARLRQDRAALGAMLVMLYQASVVIAFPAFLGLIAAAPILAPLAFGPEWTPAIAPLQILLLLGLNAATGAFNAGVLRGSGHSALMNAFRTVSLVAMIILVPLAAPYGLLAACAALVLRAWLTAPLGVAFIAHATGLTPGAQTAPTRTILAPALGMFAAAWAATGALASWPPALAAALVIGGSVALYLLLLALLAPRVFALLIELVGAVVRRDRAALQRILTPAEAAQAASFTPPAASLAAPLAKSARFASAQTTPVLSVVVCTHNRPDDVRNCLSRLIAQQTPDMEIIVVDSASQSEARGTLLDFTAAQSDIRVELCERAGLAEARNRGLACAHGEWIALLDDDAAPDGDWAAEALDLLAALPHNVGVVGAHTYPLWPEGAAPNLPPLWRGLLSLIDDEKDGDCTEAPRFVGANMFFRRAPLLEGGGFSPRFGRVGKLLLSGDEIFAARAMAQRGWRLWYSNRPRAGHRVPAERLKPAWFRQRMYWEGVTQRRLDVSLQGEAPIMPLARACLFAPVLALLSVADGPFGTRLARAYWHLGILRADLSQARAVKQEL